MGQEQPLTEKQHTIITNFTETIYDRTQAYLAPLPTIPGPCNNCLF